MMSIDEMNKSFEQIISDAKIADEKYNLFVTLCNNENKNDGKLKGIPYGCKDNILTKDILTSCSSKMLADFVPYYQAKVVDLLEQSGANLIGKTVLDEFAFGSTGENSLGKIAKNPLDVNKTTGGSSSGSAALVASGAACFALGSDTSGSVRVPASYCNVVGVKPSYETVSNDGLVACVSSMDTIGVLASNVKDSAKVLSVISENKISEEFDNSINGKTIGIPKEFLNYENMEKDVINKMEAVISNLEAMGIKMVPVSLPNLEHELTVYNIIGTAEVSSNFAKMDGIKFGYRADGDSWEEIFVNSRTEGFLDVSKERIIKGTFFMSEEGYEDYLIPAQKMRSIIINDYNNALEICDVLLTPTTPTTAFNVNCARGDEDIFTVGASLVGLPAISVPFDGIGVQIIAKRNDESNMFAVASCIEKM